LCYSQQCIEMFLDVVWLENLVTRAYEYRLLYDARVMLIGSCSAWNGCLLCRLNFTRRWDTEIPRVLCKKCEKYVILCEIPASQLSGPMTAFLSSGSCSAVYSLFLYPSVQPLLIKTFLPQSNWMNTASSSGPWDVPRQGRVLAVLVSLYINMTAYATVKYPCQ
jgi:hypothetical protein